MTTFFIIAGLLAAAALLFVLPPLLRKRDAGTDGVSRGALNVSIYRDQLRELDADLASGAISRERYDEAKRDIERRLIDESAESAARTKAAAPRGRAMAIVVGLMMPLLAAGLYALTGNPDGLSADKRAPDKREVTAQQIAGMVDKLAARLKERPEDVEGWVMLGRSYSVLGRHAEAAKAYETASTRMPENAQLLADYAGALAMAQNGKLDGEPEKLIARALKIDPDQPKVLAIAGTAAFEKGDYANAIALWERLQKHVPPESEYARSLASGITEARTRLTAQGAAPPAAAKKDESKAALAASVSGTVQLAPTLAGKVAPGDTVFIFARAVDAQGTRVPLAILKKRASELPIKFTLDDTQAMSTALSLSSVKQVLIGARISKSGDAKAQPGDLEGYVGPLSVGARDVNLTINTEVK